MPTESFPSYFTCWSIGPPNSVVFDEHGHMAARRSAGRSNGQQSGEQDAHYGQHMPQEGLHYVAIIRFWSRWIGITLLSLPLLYNRIEDVRWCSTYSHTKIHWGWSPNCHFCCCCCWLISTTWQTCLYTDRYTHGTIHRDTDIDISLYSN